MRSPLWEQQRKQAVERPATPWAVTQCSQASALSATIWAFVPDHTSAFFLAKLAQWTYPHGSSHPWLPWQSPPLAPCLQACYCCIMQPTASHWRTGPSHRKCARRSARERDWRCETFVMLIVDHRLLGGLCPWTLTPREYTITAEDSSSWSHTARSISSSPTWLQVQLEEEFQLVGERSTVQSICKERHFETIVRIKSSYGCFNGEDGSNQSTQSTAEFFKVDKAVLVLIDQSEDPERERALGCAEGPGLQEGEE